MAFMRMMIVWAFSLGVLSSCAYSFPDYPKKWAKPLESSDACAALAGSYLDLGELDERDEYTGSYKPKLRFFLLENAKELEELERIDIEFSSDRKLRVRAVSAAGVQAEALFSEAESTLVCAKESVEVASYKGITKGAGNPVVGYEHSSTTLLKASDGALVVKSSSGAYGLVYLIVPAGGSQRSWSRFPPAR